LAIGNPDCCPHKVCAIEGHFFPEDCHLIICLISVNFVRIQHRLQHDRQIRLRLRMMIVEMQQPFSRNRHLPYHEIRPKELYCDWQEPNLDNLLRLKVAGSFDKPLY